MLEATGERRAPQLPQIQARCYELATTLPFRTKLHKKRFGARPPKHVVQRAYVNHSVASVPPARSTFVRTNDHWIVADDCKAAYEIFLFETVESMILLPTPWSIAKETLPSIMRCQLPSHHPCWSMPSRSLRALG